MTMLVLLLFLRPKRCKFICRKVARRVNTSLLPLYLVLCPLFVSFPLPCPFFFSVFFRFLSSFLSFFFFALSCPPLPFTYFLYFVAKTKTLKERRERDRIGPLRYKKNTKQLYERTLSFSLLYPFNSCLQQQVCYCIRRPVVAVIITVVTTIVVIVAVVVVLCGCRSCIV